MSANADQVTSTDLLNAIDHPECPREGCTGRVEPAEHGGHDALVCADCGRPAVRILDP